jgi:uncharacterized protein (UPF0248 family)
MMPIHELINRIRWDAEFARASFTVGYYDRVKRAVVRVPFARLAFDADDHSAFIALDEDGAAHRVPYHRVREVTRDGELIWRRAGPAQRGGGA